MLSTLNDTKVFDELFDEESNGLNSPTKGLLEDNPTIGLLELLQDKVMKNKVTDSRMKVQEKKIQNDYFMSIEDQFHDDLALAELQEAVETIVTKLQEMSKEYNRLKNNVLV
ncbi:hypothetical protein V6N12_050445 [Hibiscus sabdariffa]|uniref:Uncharacterized protein n=1 Tax=Hibiscus sabdariffa TaxID=183260 RepID=A0ABR2GCE4_9ROSI